MPTHRRWWVFLGDVKGSLGDLTGGGNFICTVVLSAVLVFAGSIGLDSIKAEGMFIRDALWYAASLTAVRPQGKAGKQPFLAFLL